MSTYTNANGRTGPELDTLFEKANTAVQPEDAAIAKANSAIQPNDPVTALSTGAPVVDGYVATALSGGISWQPAPVLDNDPRLAKADTAVQDGHPLLTKADTAIQPGHSSLVKAESALQAGDQLALLRSPPTAPVGSTLQADGLGGVVWITPDGNPVT